MELVKGGLVKNDEATTHYSNIIDQMTLAIRWINATCGPCALPRAVWQLDPYCHPREQASHFAHVRAITTLSAAAIPVLQVLAVMYHRNAERRARKALPIENVRAATRTQKLFQRNLEQLAKREGISF
ncbi:hypothetical protein HPB48_007796 [Haemaphysalis longicornis]|uniref:Glycoside hydrolase family 38 N-terminal domain-containing protein n=1 Tax=Haemaphysalis longicornis TaxID=44386 RepID=A0A9J6G916_HAELO|nr:hypothetical protein HPB48_007796 [Haemaphysalis longicornis]